MVVVVVVVAAAAAVVVVVVVAAVVVVVVVAVDNGKACTNCNKKDKCENRQDRSSDNTHSDIENNIVEGVKDNENVEPSEIELLESKSQKDKNTNFIHFKC